MPLSTRPRWGSPLLQIDGPISSANYQRKHHFNSICLTIVSEHIEHIVLNLLLFFFFFNNLLSFWLSFKFWDRVFENLQLGLTVLKRFNRRNSIDRLKEWMKQIKCLGTFIIEMISTGLCSKQAKKKLHLWKSCQSNLNKWANRMRWIRKKAGFFEDDAHAPRRPQRRSLEPFNPVAKAIHRS